MVELEFELMRDRKLSSRRKENMEGSSLCKENKTWAMYRYLDKNFSLSLSLILESLNSKSQPYSLGQGSKLLRLGKKYDVASKKDSERAHLKRLKASKGQDLCFILCYLAVSCLTDRTK